MKRLIVTHNDLDGVACGILAQAAFNEIEVIHTSYGPQNGIITKYLEQNPDASIYITDMSVDESTAEKLDKHKGPVTLLDHHETAKWLNKYEWACVNTESCGTVALFEYLCLLDISWVHSVSRYQDFAALVNDYDLWTHLDPRSRALNTLLTILGPARFIKRFLADARVTFTDSELLMLEVEEERKLSYFNHVKPQLRRDNLHNLDYLEVFAEQYTSELGAYLLNKHRSVDYVLILNARTGTASLRSKGCTVNNIAQKFGGGGHPQAAGFQATFDWHPKV